MNDRFAGKGQASPSGEEELRFIRNFHDIFLSIGLAMFAAGLGVVSVLVIGNIEEGDSLDSWRRIAWIASGVSALDAVVMLALAEVFARTRRLFLPAIVILLAFSTFVSGGVLFGYLAAFAERDYNDFSDAFEQLKLLPVTVAGVTTFAIFAYYLRTKLPFAMGFGALSLAGTAVATFATYYPEAVVENAHRLQLASGLFLFLLGVIFDASDPERRGRLSDNGFWLHFFAAPLIFFSVTMMTVGTANAVSGNPSAAATTLAIVGAFAVISLLINRRALLVSGLLSAAAAIGVLISRAGLDGAWTAALTLLILGGAMVLLGGGWHTVRRILVAPFPKSGLIARIVPPEPEREERADKRQARA